MDLIHSAEAVATYCDAIRPALDNIWENWASLDAAILDRYIHEANDRIALQIDCTRCGNCCKTLMINVTDSEAVHLAMQMAVPVSDFTEQYLERGLGAVNIMKSMPCSFLNENKCTVYEHRFAGCREFPGLHLPGIKKRLFNLEMHIDRCPIIFNVVMDVNEQLQAH